MLFGALIGIVIAIVIGVALIPTIVGSLNQAKTTARAEGSEGLTGLLDVMVYVFVAVIILGAVAWIGGMGEGTFGIGVGIFGWIASLLGKRSNSWFLKNYLHKQSQRLGVQGSDIIKELGLTLSVRDDIDKTPILITKTQIQLGKDFAWYPIAKLEGYYKIVGLHRKHRNLNAAYLVGKKDGKPFALRFQDIKTPIRVCIKEVD